MLLKEDFEELIKDMYSRKPVDNQSYKIPYFSSLKGKIIMPFDGGGPEEPKRMYDR